MSSLYRQLRGFAHRVLYAPAVKKALTRTPVARQLYPPWERRHPIDAAYGIETSGFLTAEEIHPDPAVNSLIMCYGASQPSIVRRALAALGKLEEYIFVDLGCGKGRVITVASEFPFREVVGVELSPALAAIARKNAAIVARQFPARPPIRIVESNVLDFSFPAGKLAIFMYHPFKSEIVSAMVKRLESLVGAGLTHVFVVYYNPVHLEYLDESPVFERYFDESLPYESTELNFGPDAEDLVIIWQSAR